MAAELRGENSELAALEANLECGIYRLAFGDDESSGSDSSEEEVDKDGDEVDHVFTSCILPGIGRIVADGCGSGKQRRRKRTSSCISLPEKRPSSGTYPLVQLHPVERINHILNEMVNNERQFVKRLNHLNEIKTGIRSANTEHKFIEDGDTEALFPDLEPVLDLHKSHLLPALEKEVDRAQSSVTPAMFGGVFKQHIRFFLHHKQLICKQHYCRYSILKLENKNKLLHLKMEELRAKHKTEQVDVEILFAEPQKRLHNFAILFEDYIKKLKDEGSFTEDLRNAREALHDIEEVLEDINKAKRKEEMQQALLELRIQLSKNFKFDIMKPHRALYEVDNFQMYDARRDSYHSCKGYLMDDMIMVTMKNKREKITMLYCIGLKSAKVDVEEFGESDSDENGDASPILSSVSDYSTLVVYGREIVLELETRNDVAEKWRQSIETRMENPDIVCNPQDSDFPLGERAPRLHSVVEEPLCERCNVQFNRKDKKFHCEACGWVVCRGCSRNERKLAFCLDDEPRRVCDYCDARLRIASK